MLFGSNVFLFMGGHSCGGNSKSLMPLGKMKPIYARAHVGNNSCFKNTENARPMTV